MRIFVALSIILLVLILERILPHIAASFIDGFCIGLSAEYLSEKIVKTQDD